MLNVNALTHTVQVYSVADIDTMELENNVKKITLKRLHWEYNTSKRYVIPLNHVSVYAL